MSRVSKWKLEKAKVKVVFRLQFHATNIPQAGWDKLFVSFLPADSGKATAKTTKANVRNGACKWADPIYETTRLLHDSKNKQYDEKQYKFVVAMGSSRSGVLGEASINLADYADALQPLAVALPLHGSSSGTILHVTVQLLSSKTGFREFEQQRELRERGLQSGADLKIRERYGAERLPSSEDIANDQIEKVNARVRFRPESKGVPSLEEEAGLTEEYADSAVGLDGSSNTSESLYAEKHDNSSAHEIESLKSAVSADLNGLSHCEEKGDTSDHRILAQRSGDWVHGWSSDYSLDNDLAIAYEENSRLRGCLEMAESTILELKMEVSSLRIQTDEVGIETQNVAQQLSTEIASGIELEKEVSNMKSECSKLRGDLEQLLRSKSRPHLVSRDSSNSDQNNFFHGIELTWMKGILVVEEMIRDLQNKVHLSFHDSKVRLLSSDFETVLTVLQELKQENLPSEIRCVDEIRANNPHETEQIVTGNGLDVDLFQPPDMFHCLRIPSIVSQVPNSLSPTNVMEEKIFELLRELDESRSERESLSRKMDQMECYYEALVQELEENQKQMLVELQNLRNEHSTCHYAIATSSAEIESMRQEMNDQILRFNEDRQKLDFVSKELEKRATTSETALKRARLNYSLAVEQLQKDLDLLSFQVLSMFETNENFIKKTYSEGLQHQNHNIGIKKHILGGDILLEDMKKSLLLQESLYLKVEEEHSEMHVVNVSLDVFSKVLQESLLEASFNIILMDKKIDELGQQLDFSTESKKFLTLQLQSALSNVQTLTEDNASCIAKCSDISHHNQILELKFENLANENFLLIEKIEQLEALLRGCSGYQNKYEFCSAEKVELENLLKQESIAKENLQIEMSSLNEKLKSVKAEQSELVYCKENLQKLVNSLEDRLGRLLESYDKKLNGVFSSTSSASRDSGLMGVISQFEDLQFNACDKILKLLEVQKSLEDERDRAQVLSSSASSEILLAKQRFKHDIQNMAAKLDVSNALVEQLQSKLETLANKLHISLEAEGEYADQNTELLANFSLLEGDLQHLTSRNMNLAKDILGLSSVTEELERSKLTIAELTQERQDLMVTLQDKAAENVKLESELDSLKENLRFLHDELYQERSFKDNLQGAAEHLTYQLNEKNEQLLRFSQQEVELAHFRQLASDLEVRKKNLEDERDQAQVLSSSACSEILVAKQKFKQDIQNMASKLKDSNALVEKLQLELESFANKLHFCLEAEEKYTNQNNELLTNISLLEGDLQSLTSKNMELSEDILGLNVVAQEKQDLMISLQDKAADNVKLTSECVSLKENLRFLHDQLNMERNFKENLQGTIEHLTFQLNEKNEQLLLYSQQEAELERFRQRTSDLELEKKVLEDERVQAQILSSSARSEILVAKQKFKHEMENMAAKLEVSNTLVEQHQMKLESLANKLHVSLEAEEKYANQNKELLADLSILEGDLQHLTSKNNDLANDILALNSVTEELGRSKMTIAGLTQGTVKLTSQLDSLKKGLIFLQDELHVERRLRDNLQGAVDHLTFQLNEKNKQLLRFSQQEAELVHFRHLASDLELENTRVCNKLLQHEECLLKLREKSSCLTDPESQISEMHESIIAADIEVIFIRTQYATFTEELAQNFHSSKRDLKEIVLSEKESDYLISAKEELDIVVIIFKAVLDELKAQFTLLEEYNDKLQNQCNELNDRLSGQILKTEEFKNLSIHLKDLKDKAEAEFVQAREKREPEGPSMPMQESLRIAFIKEQYESRLQELRHQVSISKRHGEEMLLKLQDSVDELENKKRSEASHLKRNEELSLKILELEAELQSVVSEKREKSKAYDRIKAELECAVLSLECCKEEKQRLEASIKECNEENVPGKAYMGSSANGSTGKSLECSDQHNTISDDEVEGQGSIPLEEGDHSTVPAKLQPSQGMLMPENVHGISEHSSLEQGAFVHNDSGHLAVFSDRCRIQNLKSSMDRLQQELERMKNENIVLPNEKHHLDTNCQGLQEEVSQLNKANEELRSMFPLFNGLPGSGNALERVFALEVELAEALQAKKKSSILFQSSFLKLHSDEQAIFQSFRDINELIKEMLDLKGRHAAMESELKDMHNRYSQLSLQFAEVEGERQKLIMTLKNSRSPK